MERTLTRRIAACLIVVAIVQTAGPTAASPTPDGGAGRETSLSTPAGDAARVRNNVTAMTAQERRDFVDAVLALKSAPSPFDPNLSYYDQFVAWHLSLYPCGMGHEMGRAHGGPMFLPWHRLFVLHFEDALREVSGKEITVPYWDWTDPASTGAVFAEDFMGGDGEPNDGFAVTTGPFRKDRWTLRVHPVGLEWSGSATTYLTRHFGSAPGFTTLPTTEDVTWLLERPRYDVAPYDPASDPNLSFRNAVEGFWTNVGPARVASGSMTCGPDGIMTATSGPGVHNLAHAWVGGLIGMEHEGMKLGTMFLPTSPNDPVFFLHHTNIDRLWAEWQEGHGIDSYEPATCGENLSELGCASNTSTDSMHPPFEATPADVADIGALGYRYDTTGSDPSTSAESRPVAASDPGSPFRCDVRQTTQ